MPEMRDKANNCRSAPLPILQQASVPELTGSKIPHGTSEVKTHPRPDQVFFVNIHA